MLQEIVKETTGFAKKDLTPWNFESFIVIFHFIIIIQTVDHVEIIPKKYERIQCKVKVKKNLFGRGNPWTIGRVWGRPYYGTVGATAIALCQMFTVSEPMRQSVFWAFRNDAAAEFLNVHLVESA